MNQENIAELEMTICSDYSNIAGITVLKNGVKLYENHFNGYTADSAFHVFSVTKSILSALIGIAVDKGYIRSLDQKVLDFFPDYTTKRGEKTAQRVTIRDMLTMTTPFKYKSAPYTKYFSSKSWVKSALDLLGGKGEIGQFRYTPLIGPDILSGILTSATGQSALEFAYENLFSPLGIEVTRKVVFQTKEEQLSIMKDHHESGWVADPQGINTAGWGLFLTPSDMAKIGQLYLNRGIWDGKQTISAEWIAESTKVHSRWDELKLSYGYLWWIIDGDSYAAIGDGGNVIYVNPAKNLVIAIASLFKPTAKDRIELIKKYIEPIFED
ncbi:MAG: serine hydrolase [Oscillospiraceae bacterium]|nr:serine hydrolase [Oscillospiraceae bacterium]